MTAKDKAIFDIHQELMKSNRTWVPYRTEYNPAIRAIIRNYGGYISRNPKSHSQLIASCSFIAPSKVKYENYSKYYGEI